MKTKQVIISLFLAMSLFIYLFYRTEKTVVNEIAGWLLSRERFAALRFQVREWLPLNDFLIYSLPEGLWIFCLTLVSKPYFIETGSIRLWFCFLPLVYSVSLEYLQLLGVLNGRFDIMDLISAIGSWLLAMRLFRTGTEFRNFYADFSPRQFSCLFIGAIVYLSHVTS